MKSSYCFCGKPLRLLGRGFIAQSQLNLTAIMMDRELVLMYRRATLYTRGTNFSSREISPLFLSIQPYSRRLLATGV